MTRLSELAIGARGRVSQVHGTDAISIRLMEMGVTPSVEVAVIGAAPLGDPIELEIRGYRLSVRRSEAERVDVDTSDK
ncbi:MAG: ferrous iron transport protein A [Pirellulales bacterium]|nr:ferrous iron transport protein A [Pirellulales bacterium]